MSCKCNGQWFSYRDRNEQSRKEWEKKREEGLRLKAGRKQELKNKKEEQQSNETESELLENSEGVSQS